MPHALQESLEKSLCVKAETYSGISLLETYWKYLVSRGKGDYVELFFDAWMNSNGKMWKEELSERDYISDVLLKIAMEMGWEERIKKAVELINARSIGYIGRKDYSLFNPLQWFERVSKEKNQIWEELGWLLMNISEYASTIGDNRAFVQIGNAVSTAAANMSVSSLYRFARMVKTVRTDWVEVVFDGIISALENSLFSETELIQIWEKTVHYFSIDDAAKLYDSQNTKHKIYCADVHKALSLCIKRLGYFKLEECMEKMAPREYKQRRLKRSEHSYIVPARWYESEYYDDMNPFLESVRGMNSDEIFEYIEEQYGKSDFSWDYIKYFIQTAERLDSHSIARHKEKIIDMLKKRKAEQLEYDGVNRLYNVLFSYLTKDEIADVLTGILTVYHNHQSEGWASADYGLMNDLENFSFALFSRFNIEDNIWALQEILKMHCMWLTGSYSLMIEPIYNLRKEEYVTTWSDFWSKL